MTIRKTYRELAEFEKAYVNDIKDKAQELMDLLDSLPDGRENSLAKTKLEECAMWAVSGVTA